jgi:hypothetical protein
MSFVRGKISEPRLIEAQAVRSAGEAGLSALDGVVLPAADFAYLILSGLLEAPSSAYRAERPVSDNIKYSHSFSWINNN